MRINCPSGLARIALSVAMAAVCAVSAHAVAWNGFRAPAKGATEVEKGLQRELRAGGQRILTTEKERTACDASAAGRK